MKKPSAQTVQRRKAEVRRHITKWRCELLLSEWAITSMQMMENHEDAAATINVDLDYLRATIRIYPCFWEHKRKEREEMVVHELCHIVSEEMYVMVHDQANGRLVTPQHANSARERLTQRITNVAFDWG